MDLLTNGEKAATCTSSVILSGNAKRAVCCQTTLHICEAIMY